MLSRSYLTANILVHKLSRTLFPFIRQSTLNEVVNVTNICYHQMTHHCGMDVPLCTRQFYVIFHQRQRYSTVVSLEKKLICRARQSV